MTGQSSNTTAEKASISLLLKTYFLLADYKWLLLLAYFFFFDIGQGMYEMNSFERVDFYSINLAAWFLIFSLYMWKDGPKLMPKISCKIYQAVSFYFTWDLIDNITNAGERIMQIEAMRISLVVFLFLTINYFWQYFNKNDYTLIRSIISVFKTKKV